MTLPLVIIVFIILYLLLRQLFAKKIAHSIQIPSKVKKILTVLTLIIISVISYFAIKLDKKLYYYGKNIFSFHNPLPLNIKPVFRYDFEGGFALEDEHGFYIISQGKHQYMNSKMEFSIKEIIKYGFTDEKLIALIEDIKGEKYYIECLNNGDKHSKQDMIINVLDEITSIHLEEYKWIKIEHLDKIELHRSLLIFVFVVLLFVLIVSRLNWHMVNVKHLKRQ